MGNTGIIVGSIFGGLSFLIFCTIVIIRLLFVACDVYRAARSGRTTITTHGHPATTTIGGDTATAPGGAMDQSGFQLQKLDYEKQAAETAATADAGHGIATFAELTQPAPPPYMYTGAKPVALPSY